MKPVVDLIVAARPNFMKVAPLWHALISSGQVRPRLIHAIQHQNFELSQVFLDEFDLPSADISFEVGGGTHATQTARALVAYEAICETDPPALAVVVGDVNTTFACALAAKKVGVRVAHLEAGLRSYDRSMPEEINRILTDAISDDLWTPSLDANLNLQKEGRSEESIKLVGNIMIDALIMMKDTIEKAATQRTFLPQFDGVTVTFHRASNVDSLANCTEIVRQILKVSQEIPVAFPVHPRTRLRLKEFGLEQTLSSSQNIALLPPLSYIEFMGLVLNSRLVITDSGGVQEETSYLGIPCLTARDSTERPITISAGTNRLCSLKGIADEAKNALKRARSHSQIPYWDGKTAQRITHDIRRILDI